MKNIVLRTLDNEDWAKPREKRLGIIQLERTTLYTIEKPWLPNHGAPDGIGAGIPFVSSVPLGEYQMSYRKSHKHGDQWHFWNPNLGVYLEKDDRQHDWERYSCLFHVGNYVRDIQGCIGPGMSLIDFGSEEGLGVGSSRNALRVFNAYLQNERYATLKIV